MNRPGRFLSHTLLILGLLAVASSWYSMYRTTELKDELRAASHLREFPLAVRGMKLDLLELTEPWSPGEDLPSRYPEKLLVLVSSGACAFSQENQDRWSQLLKTIPVGGLGEVWVLSTQGHEHLAPLLKKLEPLGHPIRALQVKHLEEWGLRTGLFAVPATLLVSTDGRMLLKLSGVLDEEDLDLIRGDLSAL